MDAMRTDRPFESHGKIDHPLCGWVCFVLFFHVDVIDDAFFEWYMAPLHWCRDQFCQTVRVTVWNLENTSYVTDRSPSGHFSKGRDVSNPVFPIFFYTVLDHLIPAGILDIDIDIGHA